MKALTKILMVFAFMMTAFTVVSPSEAFAAASKCPEGAYVNEKGEWVNKSGGSIDKNLCEDMSNDLIGKVMRFVKILSTLVVVFAVGMIIYGGFKYITSQGDPKSTESAKQQIWFSAMGLFIVLTAFTILQLFLNATG